MSYGAEMLPELRDDFEPTHVRERRERIACIGLAYAEESVAGVPACGCVGAVGVEFCHDPSPTGSRFGCTRPKGHAGEHVACAVSKHDLERWLNVDDHAGDALPYLKYTLLDGNVAIDLTTAAFVFEWTCGQCGAAHRSSVPSPEVEIVDAAAGHVRVRCACGMKST